MTTVDLTADLSRVPQAYRERAWAFVHAAARAEPLPPATIDRNPYLEAQRAGDRGYRRAVELLLAIADEADAAAQAMRDRWNATGDAHPRTVDTAADAARAKVWADELAKLDAPAEPPPSYWSTGSAVERKATTAPPVFPVRFTGEDDAARLYGVLLGIQINFPRAIGVLGDRLEPILEALRGPAAPEVEEVPSDLAADAVQAVRAAQRAHLDKTRAVEIATRAIVEDVGCDAEEAGSTAFAVVEALNGAGWDPIGGRPVSPDPAAAAAFTGTAQTEARLDIADAADARTVLDALVRFVGIGGTGRRVLPDAMVSDLGDLLRGQLAGKPRETVATINALLRTLPHSSYLTVGLGTSTPEAHALLVSLGGRDRVVDYYGSALHHCCIEIDGIEWRASYTPAPSRPTIAGAAGLDMAARAGGDR